MRQQRKCQPCLASPADQDSKGGWDVGRFVKTVAFFNKPPSAGEVLSSIVSQPAKIISALTGGSTEVRFQNCSPVPVFGVCQLRVRCLPAFLVDHSMHVLNMSSFVGCAGEEGCHSAALWGQRDVSPAEQRHQWQQGQRAAARHRAGVWCDRRRRQARSAGEHHKHAVHAESTQCGK